MPINDFVAFNVSMRLLVYLFITTTMICFLAVHCLKLLFQYENKKFTVAINIYDSLVRKELLHWNLLPSYVASRPTQKQNSYCMSLFKVKIVFDD